MAVLPDYPNDLPGYLARRFRELYPELDPRDPQTWERVYAEAEILIRQWWALGTDGVYIHAPVPHAIFRRAPQPEHAAHEHGHYRLHDAVDHGVDYDHPGWEHPFSWGELFDSPAQMREWLAAAYTDRLLEEA